MRDGEMGGGRVLREKEADRAALELLSVELLSVELLSRELFSTELLSTELLSTELLSRELFYAELLSVELLSTELLYVELLSTQTERLRHRQQNSDHRLEPINTVNWSCVCAARPGAASLRPCGSLSSSLFLPPPLVSSSTSPEYRTSSSSQQFPVELETRSFTHPLRKPPGDSQGRTDSE
ncbi:unnamed protein product [Pleuronectes platessa]|uniref:Uncharacterized protein n=1 Tax=Pleuronectes platessa TaxID=8262 RepID=A0A9N7UNM6_PLEPL|nr:unnamed protein product [Pleuronectes platessa]